MAKPELSTQVSKLVKKIKDTSSDDKDAQEVFYTHIQSNVLPHASPSDCPPIQVLTHAAASILRPSLAYTLLPDLLDILAQVEHFRQLVVQQARRLLQQVKKGKLSLGVGEEAHKRLKELKKYSSTESAKGHREAYRFHVLDLCIIHIYHLFSTRVDSYMLPVLLKEYFPSLPRSRPDRPHTASSRQEADLQADFLADHYWTKLRHHDLSPAERQEVHKTGLDIRSFMLRARRWEREREAYFASLGIPEKVYEESEFFSYTRDFRHKFSGCPDEEQTVKAIEGYIRVIQTRIEALENLFPLDE